MHHDCVCVDLLILMQRSVHLQTSPPILTPPCHSSPSIPSLHYIFKLCLSFPSSHCFSFLPHSESLLFIPRHPPFAAAMMRSIEVKLSIAAHPFLSFQPPSLQLPIPPASIQSRLPNCAKTSTHWRGEKTLSQREGRKKETAV